MIKLNHPVEKLVQTITYKGVEFEVVERPDVIWVGCVNYAKELDGEPNMDATLERYQEIIDIPKKELINPDWSAGISINYSCSDKPNGLMFAQETYSDKQDEGYDLFVQTGGLWLRVLNDRTAAALLGKENAEASEYFREAQIMQKVAAENGYMENPDVHFQVEYHCHAEYSNPPHRNYAYIPIIKV